MTERSREELVALLVEHQHSYDSDCGEDYGCSCGWGDRTTLSPWNSKGDPIPVWQDEAFAQHLASVIRNDNPPFILQYAQDGKGQPG